MTDLQRRLGWLHEFERRTEGEMHGQLSDFDAGMEQLRALAKRAGIIKASDRTVRQDRP